MKIFITDSIAIKKQYKDFLFYQELFKWKLKNKNNEITLDKEPLFKENLKDFEIVAIVAQSNVKLMYDLLSFGNPVTFYKPEEFTFGKRKKMRISENKINKNFSEYLKRSYLSYLNYDGLKNVGLRRIEQFIVLLSLIPFNKLVSYDNLLLKKENKIIKVSGKIKKEISIENVSLLPFCYVLMKEFSFSFKDVSTYIFRLYSDLKITDPFDINGFKFLSEEDNEVFSIYKELVNKKFEYIEYQIELEDKSILIVKESKNSDIINNYFMFQKESYFEDKFLTSSILYPNVLILYSFLKNIIPFRDFVLTIKFLIEMNKIENEKMTCILNESLLVELNPKMNINWTKSSTWQKIYETLDYSFRDIVDPVFTKNVYYVCPICGHNKYGLTPTKLYCRNLGCNFFVNRINLKSFGIDKISPENIIEGLSTKRMLLKKANGTFLKVELNNQKNYFYFYKI